MDAAGTPARVSVVPNSGSGARDTLRVYFDNVLANPTSNACLPYYTAANNQISLRNDASTAWLLATPWAATASQNSKCSLDVAATTVH